MSSQAPFADIFKHQCAGYQCTTINWLKRAIVMCMPTPTTEAKLFSFRFLCCGEFKFQYNVLLYCGAYAYTSKAYSALAISDKWKGREVTIHKTRRGHRYSQSLQSRNTKLLLSRHYNLYWFSRSDCNVDRTTVVLK